MGIYLDIIRFNFLRFLAYPIEIWAAIVKRGISLGFLIAFWTIVANSSNGRIDLIPLISYFLISNAINDIVSAEILRFGKSVGDTVKKGTITNYLIKPVPIVPYLYASTLGERSVSLLLSIASLIAGLILNPPASLFSVGIFFVFLFFAASISLAVNLAAGIVYFYMTEGVTLRHAMSHIIKVVAGAIVPLSFFPEPWKSWALLSPFPSMIYVPTVSLQFTSFTPEVYQLLLVGAFWSITLVALALGWWRKAIKQYDAIGM